MFGKLSRRIRECRTAAEATPPRVFADSPVALPAPRAPRNGAGRWGRAADIRADEARLAAALADWIGRLEVSIRPVELAAWYPHFAMEIMRVWDDDPALERVLDRLIFNEDCDDAGFPEYVFLELLRLLAAVKERRNTTHRPPGPFRSW